MSFNNTTEMSLFVNSKEKEPEGGGGSERVKHAKSYGTERKTQIEWGMEDICVTASAVEQTLYVRLSKKIPNEAMKKTDFALNDPLYLLSLSCVLWSSALI